MNLSSAKERRALILKQLETKEEVLVSELSKETGISEVTIRKDLTILQNRKDTAITKKRMFNFREKERIGIEATKLIKEGDYIMLDSGTTTMEIAKNLHKFHNLHIVTNALNIAMELMSYKRFEVVLIGGHVRLNSYSTVGPLALSVLRNFTEYKLFLGVDSFSLENGISTPNLEEALLNQLMIQQASQVIAVFDSSKFNKRSFSFVANAKDLNTIITDSAIPAGMATKLKAMNIDVKIV